MYSPLSDTSQLLRKHAADIATQYSRDRLLSREASTVKTVLLEQATMLEGYIADSDARADSMTHVESLDRMVLAREMNTRGLVLLKNALLWDVTTSSRQKINKLQQERKSLNPNNPHCKAIDREIEGLRGVITTVERLRKYNPNHLPVPYRRKDDVGSDGGDNSDVSIPNTNTDSGTGGGSGGGSFNPAEPRVPAGEPGGGEWTSGGDGDESTQVAQEIPLPPLEEFPTDPTIPPGAGWEWKGNGTPGTQGNWVNQETGEKLNPDMDHPPPIGPHYDYTDPEGNQYRWFPDGTMAPKVIVGGIIA